MRHYIAANLLDGRHRVNVALVGAGGTGSHVLSGLAKMHHSLLAFDHPGLHVTVYDDDTVSDANVGRQLFGLADVGQNKGTVLVGRVNGYFGLDWDAVPARFPVENAERTSAGQKINIVVGCVDTGRARKEISRHLAGLSDHKKPEYWLDFGNSATTGQVILGSVKKIAQPTSSMQTADKLPTVTDLYPEIEEMDEADQTPSCSLRESLRVQDLFVNATLASLGCNLLWRFLRNSYTEVHGFFADVGGFVTNPLPVARDAWERFGYIPDC
jgi:PRTRC genetic system ThiF family protein